MRHRIIDAFASRFPGTPTLVFSPGRINLIGEHTDYNQGFVLPAAIDKAIIVALALNKSSIIRLYSLDMHQEYVETEISSTYNKTGVQWADYIIGVVSELQKDGFKIGGFDCAFGGDIPIGAGLSSSAALEGGIVFGLSELFSLDLTRLELAKIAQRAENKFVGVQCGIMDQFASLNGRSDRVMKLDCRSLEHEYYPFHWSDIRVLLCDTKIRRTLAGSEYNIRRIQCEKGVQEIKTVYPKVENLRDVTFEILGKIKNHLDPVIYRRCRFVVEENERVNMACSALLREDLDRFGELMYQSHVGLKNDYEVSCDELDILVDATRPVETVLGSRMMGGGFGGCTINLVRKEGIDEIKARISEQYLRETGKESAFHVVKVGPGTHFIPESGDYIH